MTQIDAVKEIMSDGKFRTLYEIAILVETATGNKTNAPGISARLRDLRKPQYGGYHVERKHAGDKTFLYRLHRPDGTLIRNPIPGYGTPESIKPPAPVAGATSAMRYCESLS